ncbi:MULTISPECIES: hypothetical protein [unclassified Moorena]|nr:MULTISPECIES: hypothetical protein [unclassified Moorena]NEO16152.1 hypothetical protein [Moorena sp. SIO3E8]NEQ02681.1 hypothetical protein [Moorena sp. SIO3F7]
MVETLPSNGAEKLANKARRIINLNFGNLMAITQKRTEQVTGGFLC